MPLTTDDFASGNRLAIFTDTDKPCATMLVFVHMPGTDIGTWEIEYVRGSRRIQGKISPVDENDLTPLHDFGLNAVFSREAALLYIKQDTDRRCTATYKDGRTREWQGRMLVGVHPDMLEALDVFYA